LFLYLDGCNNLFDFLRFHLLRLFLLSWLFLTNATMRRNIFNFDHISYIKAWSKLEKTPLTADVELDLPLADVDGSSHCLEERPPKDEW
jgi:hypothetical protein